MNILKRHFCVIWVGFVMGAQSLFAQAGNDNPGGVTNDYNGSSTVAGRYDPYTGNASRAIDDIVVTGGIGAYPHKLTRTLSTRGGRGGNQFGEGGGWTHNYSSGLTIFPSNENDGEDGWYSGQPAGQITYPGGAHFDLPYSDGPPWRISGANGRLGCDDILADLGSGYYELRQCDGGKVLFEPAPTPTSYQAYAIIDPFGQTTTLAYDANGRLWKVTEPGGRYLEFFYQTFSYWTQTNPPMLASEDVILMVQANDGRGNVMETVTYEYESVWISSGGLSAKMYNLKTVRYDDLSQASYTYAPANTNWTGNSVSHETAWIVQTCDDPRYAGPMKQIQYEYVQRSEASPDFVGRGQLKAEKNLYGQIVSRTTFPTSINDPARLQRTETRGDGRTRSFNYPITASPTEFSFTWTDFQNHTSGYMGASIIDPRGNATTYEREPVLGAVRKVIRPPTYPGENATVEFAYTDPSNPYFHSGEKDENDHWTYYDRDDHNRVWQIRYPDGSTEEFTYNNFGQVVTHKLRSGGTETFTYDTRGLKQTSYPPATESDPDPWNHPTRYYYYQSGPNTDRLQVVTDPRGNSTAYEYNQRGQVTHIQHQDYTYVQNGYNLDGTLAWTYDENHPGAATDPNQRIRYTYDEYKRVLTVTNPMGETTENCYALDPAWADPTLRQPLLHTTNSIKYTKSPMQKNIVYGYDENFRKQYQVAAFGTPADEAWTFFDYDEVGNLNWIQDPRWKVTRFGYDARNRKIWMDDPIAADRNNSGHTMNWEYNGVGNKMRETRADNAYRSWDYDTMNRVLHAFDWRYGDPSYQITSYVWNTTGTYQWITDAKGAIYTFIFDALGRKLYDIYPSDQSNASRLAAYWYDEAGNLIMYKNPTEQYRHFSYDERNRQRHSWWNSNAGPDIVTNYDNASRMTDITTNNGETVVAFYYDEANRKTWEGQTVAGLSTQWVYTPRDADGNRTVLQSGGYYFSYEYTQRNQLARIRDGSNSPVCEFTYDPSGNMTQRRIAWFYSSPSNFDYDDLNRVTMFEDGNNGGIYARSHYQYDTVGREAAVWRDEDGSKGDRFSYSANNQLTGARYKGEWAWAGEPGNPVRSVDYTYTPDMLNRQSVSDNGVATNYTMPNGMNQYTSVGGENLSYDDNRFNLTGYYGAAFSYNAQNQLISASNAGTSAQFVYDGLGRCVKRTINGVTRFITYDDWNPIYEWDVSGNAVDANFYGARADEIIGRWDSSLGFLFYKQDKQGNVVTLLDQGGTILERYRYDAFGKPTITDWWGNPHVDGNNQPRSWYGNRFMFTGREYLSQLGIYDYRHRYYNPSLGRFLQSDPMGLQTEGAKLTPEQKALSGAGAPETFGSSEMNLYRYCGDDPVDNRDPTGTDLIPSVESAVMSTAIGIGAHLFFRVAQALGHEPDDQVMHFETSRLMTEFGDPVTTYLLGEAKEKQHWGPDTPLDRHSNHEGIKEGIRNQLGPLRGLVPESHKRTPSQLLAKPDSAADRKKTDTLEKIPKKDDEVRKNK